MMDDATDVYLELLETKEKLRKLEDAIYKNTQAPEVSSDEGSHVIIVSFGEDGFMEINEAIENSHRRQKHEPTN